MNVTGKTTLFVKSVGSGEKAFNIFETSVSHRNKEGDYLDRFTIRVEFDKELVSDENRAKFKVDHAYQCEITEGFLTSRGYLTKDNQHRTEPLIFIRHCKFTGEPKPIKKAEAKDEALEDNEDQLPF